MPACTSRTPWRTFSGVRRLMRPSSSSSPQSPQVDPGGRSFHRFVTTSPSGPTDARCTGQLRHEPFTAPNALEAEVENWLVERVQVDLVQRREQFLVRESGEEAVDCSFEVGDVALESLVEAHVLEAPCV